MSIIASRVPNKLRLEFFPKHFGFPLMSIVEHSVYSWMRALSEDYNGGGWHFYQLSNKGVYLAPACKDRFLIGVPTNGFVEKVSADAAGIIATIFALNYLCNKSASYSHILYDKYYLLLDFADEHKESNHIFSAID